MKTTGIIVAVSVCLLMAQVTATQAQEAGGESQSVSSPRDGAHDFDWDIGTWKIHQKRLLRPLTGSTSWVQYDGTDVVEKLWDGGNAGRIDSAGSAGRLELYTLRLYDADAHQWKIYFASRGGALSQPVVGEFNDGRGNFYDQEPYRGRMIFVRFRVYAITHDSCQFDQAFSVDGGATWETNFIVTETLLKRPT